MKGTKTQIQLKGSQKITPEWKSMESFASRQPVAAPASHPYLQQLYAAAAAQQQVTTHPLIGKYEKAKIEEPKITVIQCFLPLYCSRR